MKAFGFVAQSFDTLFHEVYSFEESDKESVGDSLVKSKTKADIDTADDSSISTGQTNNRGRPVPPPVLARPPSNSLPANSILKKKAPNPLKYSMERESVPSVSNASLSEEAPDPASPIKRNRSEEELATESMVNAVQTWFGKKKTSTHSVSFSTEEVASIETSGDGATTDITSHESTSVGEGAHETTAGVEVFVRDTMYVDREHLLEVE
jgi:hypothetical protein